MGTMNQTQGNVHYRQDECNETLINFQQAYDIYIYISMLYCDPLMVVAVVSNIGSTFNIMGNYSAAYYKFDEALNTQQRFAPRHSNIIFILNNMEMMCLVVGCLRSYSLQLSKLECFYDLKCLKKLAVFVNSSYIPSRLKQWIKSRFIPVSNTTIGRLIDELFIESWQNTSNYSSYYSICAPSTCRYTYIERNSVLYILTTFLGLYGGLTEGLQFVISYSLYLFWKIRQWFNNHQNKVIPVHNNT
ncbi:hypothetical protein I4U23_010859 [Adineta vaga]|nr:hypothetical protein I4U23_010859 [Adineta vaga]